MRMTIVRDDTGRESTVSLGIRDEATDLDDRPVPDAIRLYDQRQLHEDAVRRALAVLRLFRRAAGPFSPLPAG